MKRKIFTLLSLIFTMVAAMAQTPDMYPPPVPEPVELTLLNIIIYFILPVILIVFYFFYRRSKRKKKKNSKEDSR